MEQQSAAMRFPTVGDGSGFAATDSVYKEELQLALRNRGWKGYQMTRVYRYSQTADEPGEAVDLIRVRALMIPPGIPDFMTRTRLVDAGPVTLAGKAWAGRLTVSRVEVSVDSGSTWFEAQLGKSVSPNAWKTWAFLWNARPGTYTLCVRATDSKGNVQPLEQQWNYGGYGNNSVQRVTVIVE